MKIVKLANTDKRSQQRKLLVARLAQILLELLDTTEEIERLRRDDGDRDQTSYD
ncbi:MAG TPA: hypothetical protein VMP11_17635 [Verrucomicrobiae bacterium]|nr:hypothetical protein [Verrucomicrobiae bacterium]